MSRDAGFGPGAFHTAADLIEVAVRSGREDIAAGQIEQLQAGPSTQPWTMATISRGLGLLARGDDAEAHLRQAIGHYRDAASPFDEARTMLDLGLRLRRQRRPIAARDATQRALGIFERLGAAPWVRTPAGQFGSLEESCARMCARSSI